MLKELEVVLDVGHWDREDYRQRMSTADWTWLLLKYQDTIIFKGIERQLIAKKIFSGVVEVYKKPHMCS